MKNTSTVVLFFFFVSTFLVIICFSFYLNQRAGENFIGGKKIVITPNKNNCNLNDTTNEIVLGPDGIYKVPDSVLVFNTTTDPVNAGNYKTICNEACEEKGVVTCNKETPIFKQCNKLLEPPSGCTNNSNPLGVDQNGKIVFATSINFN